MKQKETVNLVTDVRLLNKCPRFKALAVSSRTNSLEVTRTLMAQ